MKRGRGLGLAQTVRGPTTFEDGPQIADPTNWVIGLLIADHSRTDDV